MIAIHTTSTCWSRTEFLLHSAFVVQRRFRNGDLSRPTQCFELFLRQRLESDPLCQKLDHYTAIGSGPNFAVIHARTSDSASKLKIHTFTLNRPCSALKSAHTVVETSDRSCGAVTMSWSSIRHLICRDMDGPLATAHELIATGMLDRDDRDTRARRRSHRDTWSHSH